MDVSNEYRAYDLWPAPAPAPAPVAPQYQLWCPRCGRDTRVTARELRDRRRQGQIKCCGRPVCCLLLPETS